MLIPKIAFRNIFRHRRRSLLTGMMMTGGFVIFSLSFGFVDGSYDMIIEMFTGDRTGHVQVHEKGYLEKPSLFKRINDVSSAGRRIESVDSVKAWAPRVYGPALAFAGKKTTGLRLTGIDPEREPRVTAILPKIGTGRFISDDPYAYEIIIPERTARVLRVAVGEEIALISQAADGSVANDLFTVVGLIKAGDTTYDYGVAFTNIDTAREFFALGGKAAHEIAITLYNHRLSWKAAEEINAALGTGSLKADPWQVVESQFYQAMQADLKGNWITLIVLTIIVAVGVLNTVLMVILERTREYGVLKAIGTRPRQIFVLIVTETLILALFSIAVGILGGLAGNAYFEAHGIMYPEPIEWGGIMIEQTKARITPRSLWIPALVIFSTAFVVSLWPAARAARITPVRALREG